MHKFPIRNGTKNKLLVHVLKNKKQKKSNSIKKKKRNEYYVQ